MVEDDDKWWRMVDKWWRMMINGGEVFLLSLLNHLPQSV